MPMNRIFQLVLLDYMVFQVDAGGEAMMSELTFHHCEAKEM